MWHACSNHERCRASRRCAIARRQAGGRASSLITVFALPDEHPLSALTAVQRLQRIGIEIAIEQRHQQGAPGQAVMSHVRRSVTAKVKLLWLIRRSSLYSSWRRYLFIVVVDTRY